MGLATLLKANFLDRLTCITLNFDPWVNEYGKIASWEKKPPVYFEAKKKCNTYPLG